MTSSYTTVILQSNFYFTLENKEKIHLNQYFVLTKVTLNKRLINVLI